MNSPYNSSGFFTSATNLHRFKNGNWELGTGNCYPPQGMAYAMSETKDFNLIPNSRLNISDQPSILPTLVVNNLQIKIHGVNSQFHIALIE
jgi:hypothetical protein